MDFDLGNILYVVITLVAIIAGLLGKKKKPSKQAPDGTETEARPGFLENIERVLRMGQEGPQVTDLQDYEEDVLLEEMEPNASLSSKPGAETVIPSKSILDDYDRIMNSMTEMDQNVILTNGDQKGDSLKHMDMDRQGGTDYFEIVKDFDAGTAVVYAAIINRLDY
jgi:hypothetical protein